VGHNPNSELIMGKGIGDFIGGGGSSNVEKFEKASKGEPKKKVRKLEMALLKPEVLPPHVGKRATADTVSDRTVMLVFKTTDEVELFAKYFKVSTYVTKNVSVQGMKLMSALLKEMEAHNIRFNKKKGKIAYRKGLTS